MHSSNPPSYYPTLRAANSLALMTIAMSGMYASIMVLEPVTREFGIGRGAGALPYTLYMIGFGLGNIVLGKLMDRFGMPILAFVASVCLPAGLYLASTAQTLWQFTFILSVLCGFLGGAFAFGPLVADISKWFDQRRGLAVGIVISGSYVAGAIWPPLLQTWIDTNGWRHSLVLLAIICAVTMLPLSFIYLRRPPGDSDADNPDQSTRWQRPLGITARQLQCLICFAGIGCCVAMAMPQIHIVPHAIDLGFRAIDGATMLALMLGFGIISRVGSGWISDRIGGVKTLILGSGLQALVILQFLFVSSLEGLYLVSIAFGLSQGGIVPSYTIIIRKFFRASEAGTRIGLIFVATTGGMALGGWMAGFLYDLTGSYTVSFINAVGFNILNIAMATFMLHRESRALPT